MSGRFLVDFFTVFYGAWFCLLCPMMESQNPQIENRGVNNQSHLQEKVLQGRPTQQDPPTLGIAIADMIDNIVGTGTRNGCIGARSVTISVAPAMTPEPRRLVTSRRVQRRMRREA